MQAGDPYTQRVDEISGDMDRVRREREMLLEIYDLTDDLALLFDAEGRLVHLNAAARRFFGFDEDEVRRRIGSWRPEVAHLDDLVALLRDDPGGFTRWSGEIEADRHDGERVPMLLQVLAHRAGTDATVDFYSAVGRDISDRKVLEATLARQATIDPLTGLANRTLLFDRIQRALDGLRSVGSRHAVALLFIDLDHFKAVNDSLGHDRGDQILIVMAERILSVVRPGDTVARFGGDEFVVLCERLDQPEDAVVIAHRIDASLRDPVVVGDRTVTMGVSIGISYPDGDVDPSTVLRDADTAMYRAKESGRGRWVIFDDEVREHALARRRIETSLRGARDGEGLELRYQPVINLRTRSVVAVEALLRWNLDGELLSPEQFVPVAETSGLIVPIGAWVLETATAQAARWQRMDGHRGLRMSVNVSPRQIEDPAFSSLVAAALDRTRLTHDTLWLEITESVLVDDVATTRARLERLRVIGARIALDDFGTGHSSLTYLRQFPVDAVKLDRSFVAGVLDDEGDAAIVAAVISLAGTLGKLCIAEGIEEEQQVRSLLAMGCHSGQGYLFAPPLSAAAMSDLLARSTAFDQAGSTALDQAGQSGRPEADGRSRPAV